MGSKKTTQTQVNQAPQFVQPPISPYFKAAEQAIGGIDHKTSIRQAYGKQMSQIQESGNEMFGYNQPQEVTDRIRQARMFRATTDLGQNLSEADQSETAAKTAGYMSLGGATAPYKWEPGGTMTQTTPFNWGSLLTSGIMGGAQIASAGFGGSSAGSGSSGRNGAVSAA